MTHIVLRVEGHADSRRVEPLSRRIRLAACRALEGAGDGKPRSMAAARAA